LPKKLYIGPAGWSYPDWAGSVYPPKKQRGFDPLEFISSYFNLVEINSTFYRAPAPETSRRWAERVAANPEFRFTLKAHNEFTHAKSSTIDPRAVDNFKRAVAPLFEAGRLLCVLVQFPWSFKNTATNVRRVRRLSELFRPFPVAVEVRHGGWARDGALDEVSGAGVSICAVDQPNVGDSLNVATRRDGEPGAYFRLHGRNKSEWFRPGTNRDLRYNYLYSHGELKQLAGSIRGASETARQVVVVLNNHFRGQAVANALELKWMLTGENVAVPQRLLGAFPRLRPVSLPDPNAVVEEGWLFDPDSAAENNQE